MPPVPCPPELLDTLRQQTSFVLATHTSPDGDALGSMVAMAALLRAAKKDVALYTEEDFPPFLSWLVEKLGTIKIYRQPDFDSRLLICLDSGDAKRLGPLLENKVAHLPCVNMDHHLGNTQYASLVNWIDPSAAATGVLVARAGKALAIPLTGLLAEGLYVAFVSDTGGFAFGNTNAEVLRFTADLLESGLPAARVREKMDNSWTAQKIAVWGRLMAAVQVEANGQLASAVVSLADPKSDFYGATKEDMEGIVEQMRKIRGVRVALFLREDTKPDGSRTVKASLRSSGEDDVRAVAAFFGGGGHKNAAGATMPLNLVESAKALKAKIQELVLANPVQNI